MKPNELRQGYTIDAGRAGRFGHPIVVDVLIEPPPRPGSLAARDYHPQDARVEVDVEFERQPDMRTWDMDQFRDAVGAAGAQWLSTTPTSRYRLYYLSDAEIPIRRG